MVEEEMGFEPITATLVHDFAKSHVLWQKWQDRMGGG